MIGKMLSVTASAALLLAALLCACGPAARAPGPTGTATAAPVLPSGVTFIPRPTATAGLEAYAEDPTGMTVETRFPPPAGFERVPVAEGSYAAWLRGLPLKAAGEPALLYDGSPKPGAVYAAVVDIDVGGRDLQQCADTVMRYRAEYLWHAGRADEIAFHFTSGFLCEWSRYRQGWRVRVDGNDVRWERTGRADDSRDAFRRYLDLVFNYAGTRSLEAYETEPVAPVDMRKGDLILRGESPGHVVQVVDMAAAPDGRKCFLLVQGYMPAQEGHIRKSFEADWMGPWYTLPADAAGELRTPEYTFDWDDLRRFKAAGE